MAEKERLEEKTRRRQEKKLKKLIKVDKKAAKVAGKPVGSKGVALRQFQSP